MLLLTYDDTHKICMLHTADVAQQNCQRKSAKDCLRIEQKYIVVFIHALLCFSKDDRKTKMFWKRQVTLAGGI